MALKVFFSQVQGHGPGGETQERQGAPTFITRGAEPPHFSHMTCIGHHKMLSGGACPKQDTQETKVFSSPHFQLAVSSPVGNELSMEGDNGLNAGDVNR